MTKGALEVTDNWTPSQRGKHQLRNSLEVARLRAALCMIAKREYDAAVYTAETFANDVLRGIAEIKKDRRGITAKPAK